MPRLAVSATVLPRPRIAIAALSGAIVPPRGMAHAGLAVLALSIALGAAASPAATDGAAAGPGQAQLLPFGEFVARDGRPGNGLTFKLDNAGGRAIATAMSAIARQTPIPIDYEHQTLHVIESGKPAPAAGWITDVTWRDGVGAFATVSWTPKAKALIDGQEYRYFSPVITFDEKTGEVTGVLMGALVNFPALLGMAPVVAALSGLHSRYPTDQETHTVDRTALIALLGLSADATDAQINAAIAALSTELPALRARPARVTPLSTAVAAALGVAADADETAALSAVATLRNAQGGGQAAAAAAAAATAIAALQGQLAELQGRMSQGEVDELVTRAITERRALPALKDFLTQMGRKSVADLKAFIAASPVIDGLQGQSGGEDRGGGGTAALSGQADLVRQAFGLTAEQWAAAAPKKAA